MEQKIAMIQITTTLYSLKNSTPESGPEYILGQNNIYCYGKVICAEGTKVVKHWITEKAK